VLNALTEETKVSFAPNGPNFVIELRFSWLPQHHLFTRQMQEYIDNGIARLVN